MRNNVDLCAVNKNVEVIKEQVLSDLMGYVMKIVRRV